MIVDAQSVKTTDLTKNSGYDGSRHGGRDRSGHRRKYNMDYMTLNNGEKMPQLGFGVYQIPNEETKEAVYQAVAAGYRLIATAVSYGNEAEVGAGVARAITDGLVSREDLFITTC